jgi:hypothetical protein
MSDFLKWNHSAPWSQTRLLLLAACIHDCVSFLLYIIMQVTVFVAWYDSLAKSGGGDCIPYLLEH